MSPQGSPNKRNISLERTCGQFWPRLSTDSLHSQGAVEDATVKGNGESYRVVKARHAAICSVCARKCEGEGVRERQRGGERFARDVAAFMHLLGGWKLWEIKRGNAVEGHGQFEVMPPDHLAAPSNYAAVNLR